MKNLFVFGKIAKRYFANIDENRDVTELEIENIDYSLLHSFFLKFQGDFEEFGIYSELVNVDEGPVTATICFRHKINSNEGNVYLKLCSERNYRDSRYDIDTPQPCFIVIDRVFRSKNQNRLFYFNLSDDLVSDLDVKDLIPDPNVRDNNKTALQDDILNALMKAISCICDIFDLARDEKAELLSRIEAGLSKHELFQTLNDRSSYRL